MGDRIRAVLAAFLWWFFALASPASAGSIAIAEFACTGGAASAEEAFALTVPSLDCSSSRFSKRDRFVRAHIDLSRAPLLPPGRLIWQTDPTSFDAMLVRLTYADGQERLIDVDAEMAVRNWDANGHFWVAFDSSGATLRTMDVVVERPQAPAILERMTISSLSEAVTANESRRLLYALLCGMLLLPIIYDLFFFRALRERFMLWHLAMCLGALGYVLCNSGLIFLLRPDMASHVRFSLIFISAGVIVLGVVRFSILIIEPGMLDQKLARIETRLAILALLGGVMMLPDLELLRQRLLVANFLILIPIVVLAAVILVKAYRRSSRVAGYLGIAFVATMVATLLQVSGGLGLVRPNIVTIDDATYVALLILVIGTSAAVGDRFLVIKGERDRARISARKLGAMANTDGLTGLLNRRAFDQHGRLALGQALLLADLDRFKQINDSFGHQRGDAVLCGAGRAIQDAVARLPGTTVYRLGGEEFAVLAPADTVEDVRAICETVRVAVEEAAGQDGGLDLPAVTASVGAVMGTGQLMHVAFSDADEALYRAKETGRNRFIVAEY